MAAGTDALSPRCRPNTGAGIPLLLRFFLLNHQIVPVWRRNWGKTQTFPYFRVRPQAVLQKRSDSFPEAAIPCVVPDRRMGSIPRHPLHFSAGLGRRWLLSSNAGSGVPARDGCCRPSPCSPRLSKQSFANGTTQPLAGLRGTGNERQLFPLGMSVDSAAPTSKGASM